MPTFLSELIPVVTPLGEGYALIFESCIFDNYWTVILQNGALVTFPQRKIRVKNNYTHGRGISDDRMREIIK